MKILCVDDEICILKSLRRLFRMAGYKIATASSAQAGLDIMAEDSAISLVISDYQMPGANGVSFLREIRRNWPETGRFLLTGYADKQEMSLAIADRVIQRLIDKPWQDDERLASVAQRLGPPATGTLFRLSI
ncbi:MAG: response regulator [Chloroflexi bacterium]|nr:response regulator [Chloroflexota bacterium]